MIKFTACSASGAEWHWGRVLLTKLLLTYLHGRWWRAKVLRLWCITERRRWRDAIGWHKSGDVIKPSHHPPPPPTGDSQTNRRAANRGEKSERAGDHRRLARSVRWKPNTCYWSVPSAAAAARPIHRLWDLMFSRSRKHIYAPPSLLIYVCRLDINVQTLQS